LARRDRFDDGQQRTRGAGWLLSFVHSGHVGRDRSRPFAPVRARSRYCSYWRPTVDCHDCINAGHRVGLNGRRTTPSARPGFVANRVCDLTPPSGLAGQARVAKVPLRPQLRLRVTPRHVCQPRAREPTPASPQRPHAGSCCTNRWGDPDGHQRGSFDGRLRDPHWPPSSTAGARSARRLGRLRRQRSPR